MTARLTASGAERAIACPASLALPQAVDEPSDAALRGTAAHDFLLAVGQGMSRDEALDKAPDEWRPFLEAIDLEGLPLSSMQWAHEVAIAVNVQTGEARELCRGKGRPDYAAHNLGPFEIGMTLDVVGLADGLVVVDDYKTGWSELPPPARNWQLKVCALGAARLFGCDEALVGLIRIRDDGSAWRPRRARLDAWALDDVADELQATLARAAHASKLVADGAQPPTNPGEHCRYCRAFTSCPAQTALIRSAADVLADIDGDDERELLAGLTLEQVADVYRKHRLMSRALGRLGDELHRFGRRQPIPLGDGRVFGAREVEGNEQLDGAVVYQVGAAKYGHEAAARMVTMKATKKDIRAVVKAERAKGVTIKAAEAELLDGVREAGGARRKTSVRVEEFDLPAPALEEPAAEPEQSAEPEVGSHTFDGFADQIEGAVDGPRGYRSGCE